MSSLRASGSCSKVLFAQAGTMHKPCLFRLHQHEFWQLEILQGRCEILSEGSVIAVKESAAVIFPPQTRHGFRYPGEGEAYYSVKFEAEMPGIPGAPLFIKTTPFTRAWLSCCRTLLQGNTSESVHGTVRGLLDGLLHHLAPELPRTPGGPAWLARVQGFIRSNSDRPLTVQETAESVGMTRGYLTTQFHKATGMTVKAAIDAERLKLSKSMLEYADSSITQVADQLGFPDVFAFSRFFKAREGIGPNQFRKAHSPPSSAV